LNTLTEAAFLVLTLFSWIITPIILIWGWTRWTKTQKLRTASSFLSLSGFILATSSALLAFSAVTYAHILPNGFPFYDPSLMRIYKWGALLSIGGFCLGIGGVWRKNSLRWHSPISALGMFSFWLLAAEGE
jgi:hypothetical protein